MKKIIYVLIFLGFVTNVHGLRRSTKTDNLDQDPVTGKQVAPANPDENAPSKPHANARKNWRRFGLIAGGVAVAVGAIAAVNSNQGKKAN